MKEFTFSVSAVLEYTVQAKTELQALKILVEKADYENAELIETREIE